MTKFVALLRGINVGGNAKVEMTRLKNVFEEIGCQNVVTYINSGNVIFDDDRNQKKLAGLIEKAIEKEFKLAVPAVLRDKKNIEMLAKKIPAGWDNKIQKTEVMFLWDEVDNRQAVKHIAINPKVEKLIYLPGALIWNVDRKLLKPGAGAKIIKSELYNKMTGRNINTVRKLAELMQST